MDTARKAVLSLTPHKGSPFTDPACVHRLYVGDFDECLSDIHCPVFIKLKTGTDSHETIHNVNVRVWWGLLNLFGDQDLSVII